MCIVPSLLPSLPKQIKLLIKIIMYDRLHPLVLRQKWNEVFLQAKNVFILMILYHLEVI